MHPELSNRDVFSGNNNSYFLYKKVFFMMKTFFQRNGRNVTLKKYHSHWIFMNIYAKNKYVIVSWMEKCFFLLRKTLFDKEKTNLLFATSNWLPQDMVF